MGKAKRLRKQREQETEPQDSSLYPVGARSFELKMWRANVHLKQLKAEVDGWIKDALKTIEEEPDPEHPGYHASWVTPPTPDHASLSLRAGDCLQCLRSALDHLAFELAAAFTVPMTDQIEESSEFPIVSDLDRRGQSGSGPRKWRDGAHTKVGGADPLAQAAIERLQPYQRGASFEDDPLWRLGVLNNIDKHRTIHVVGIVSKGAVLPVAGPNLPRSEWPINVASIGFANGRVSEIEIPGDVAAESRTKVARWAMSPIDPSKEMRMNFKPVLDIAFGADTPLVGGASVFETLGDLHNYILSDVVPPLLGFLK